MSEDLNLPASLERLEINPERADCGKHEQNPFHLSEAARSDPECSLKTLSLKAECTKGSCQCNKKKNRETSSTLKRVTQFKRPILRRSKLNPVLLRAPVLRISSDGCPTHSPPDADTSSPPLSPPQSVIPQSRVCDSRQGAEVVEVARQQVTGGSSSCSVQARISPSSATSPPPPDDTTIDELASYFDLFVHIPKKMSLMAEMMYI